MNCLERIHSYRLKEKNYAFWQDYNHEEQVRFYNFWKGQDIPDMWFYRFAMHRNIVKDGKKLCFFSTFGDRDVINKANGDVNVFFSGENLKRKSFSHYADHLLENEKVNLALGFEYFEDQRYFRFPLWLHYMFEPESTSEQIRARCEQLTHPIMQERPRFACHVSSEDTLGLRKKVCDSFSQISRVDCAGKIMHNCDDLWNEFKNDKHAFLQQYRFNICPENSNAQGYVTEKVFQAIAAGCIPVYWGSYNCPEPEVLNPDAILFWNKDADNESLLNKVRDLDSSPNNYIEFASQPRIIPTAAEYIINEFDELENRLKVLFANI